MAKPDIIIDWKLAPFSRLPLFTGSSSSPLVSPPSPPPPNRHFRFHFSFNNRSLDLPKPPPDQNPYSLKALKATYSKNHTISTPMTPFVPSPSPILALTLIFVLISFSDRGVKSATFTFVNNCGDTIWPGVLSNSGSPLLEPTGFALPAGTSSSLSAPTGWSGRFWARTACSSDASGRLTCATGDCGSGSLECNGAAASPPTTLAEFTLSSAGGNDFYDVSLVDGYNLPVIVESSGGVGGCEMTGCAVDLNPMCPMELRVGEGEACRSACEAFGQPEYCCSGEFGTPTACRPSVYSEMFKSACPRAYSYAYDDASSTFTCAGGDYSITFCPETTQR